MIARVRVLLPWRIQLESNLSLLAFREDVEDINVLIYPPYKAKVDYSDLNNYAANELFAALSPESPAIPTSDVLIGGVPVIEANALRFDIIKEKFDRSPDRIDHSPILESGDPSLKFSLFLTNSVLRRLRSATKAKGIKPIQQEGFCTVLEYLNDDGTTLASAPPLIRRSVFNSFHFDLVPLTTSAWRAVTKQNAYFEMPLWENLLLDAKSFLPDIGASIVLTATALETLIAACLRINATSTQLPEGMWEWLKDRDGDYRKQPSVDEKFDKILRFMTGQSLKDQPDLWQGYIRIKKARNQYVHEGKLELNGEIITIEQCRKFLRVAEKIINWVETLMPRSERRIQPEQITEVTFTKRLVRTEIMRGPGTLRLDKSA